MAPMTTAEYSKLKVTELKELLTARGLPTNGVKSELVSRLVSHDATNPQATAPATEAKKDDSINPDDYDINWDDEDHAGTSAASKSATSAAKPAAAAATTTTTKPAAAATTTAPASTAAPAKTKESTTEAADKKKFQFKSIAAQFEEEARQKAEAAEAAKKAAEEAKALEAANKPAEETAKTTDAAPVEEPKPTGPISSKLETLPADHPAPLTLDEELERRKKRAERFGMSVEDSEAIKKLERAKKFGAGGEAVVEKADGEAAEGEPSEKKVVIVKGLDQALGHEKKRRFEGNGRGEDKRRRGGSFGGGQRGGNRGRGGSGFRGGRGGNTGGEKRSGPPPTGPKKITDDPAEKAKAEARAKRFAAQSS